jgi:hypothetical protein
MTEVHQYYYMIKKEELHNMVDEFGLYLQLVNTVVAESKVSTPLLPKPT